MVCKVYEKFYNYNFFILFYYFKEMFCFIFKENLF